MNAKQADAMRVMAERYLSLAKASSEPGERTKFFDYASIYAQLPEQAERQDAPATVVDTR